VDTAVITGCEFTDCSTSNLTYGHAVYMGPKVLFVVTGNTFIRCGSVFSNTAPEGSLTVVLGNQILDGVPGPDRNGLQIYPYEYFPGGAQVWMQNTITGFRRDHIYWGHFATGFVDRNDYSCLHVPANIPAVQSGVGPVSWAEWNAKSFDLNSRMPATAPW
jgi:hypothetical protein